MENTEECSCTLNLHKKMLLMSIQQLIEDYKAIDALCSPTHRKEHGSEITESIEDLEEIKRRISEP